MASQSQPSAQQVSQQSQSLHFTDPPTPPDMPDNDAPASSQESDLPPTQPPSPLVPATQPPNTADLDSEDMIPSSMTPPPSSQVPVVRERPNGIPPGFTTRRSLILSPSTTNLSATRRELNAGADYLAPTPHQVLEAAPDELRAMLQASIMEQSRLKMETAHHKLQYNLLQLQADEDAKRATVEHEMTRREVEALRMAEHSRQARRELSAAAESTQAKYLQLKIAYEQMLEENEALRRRMVTAKKIIQQKEDEAAALADEKELLLTRLRENREHFHVMTSPGGMFYGALTPKTTSGGTPRGGGYRATPKQNLTQTPRSAVRDARPPRESVHEGLDFLLSAVDQAEEGRSAPSTPTMRRALPRSQPKHVRGAQSLSSLPTTPAGHGRVMGGLLPSVDLVPQTEPPRYSSARYAHDIALTPIRDSGRRKSRESTISADEGESGSGDLDRQALASVAARAQASLARAALPSGSFSQSQRSRVSLRVSRGGDQEDEEDVFESQASQAASEMLRRDPRESFEVASSAGGVGSEDVSPVRGGSDVAKESARLQAKLFASTGKSGGEKRKFSGGHDGGAVVETSPTKKMKAAAVSPGVLRDAARIGLGIMGGRDE